MAAGKWTAPIVRARCQARAVSRADAEAARPKHKAKRAACAARKTAERRADCARRYARDCDARTDTRLAEEARVSTRARPPAPRYAHSEWRDGVRGPPSPVAYLEEDGRRDALEPDEDDMSSSDGDAYDLDAVHERFTPWRLEHLVEDTGLENPFLGSQQLKDRHLNLPTAPENAWRKAAVLAVIQFRFNDEGRPLDEDGEELTVLGPSTETESRDPSWVPRAFRNGRVIDNFHPSHLGMRERMNLFDENHGMIGDAIREHQLSKGEAPSFRMKWSGHLECGVISVMNDGWWRYAQTVDWGWLSYDNWATAQRWYVPSSGYLIREVFLEARPGECTPSPCTWIRLPHPTRGMFDEFGNELPKYTYHRDQYNGPQHHTMLAFDMADGVHMQAEPKYAWQLPFGPMRKAFDEWCDLSNLAEIQRKFEASKLDYGFGFYEPSMSAAERAFIAYGGSGSRNPALRPVVNAIWDKYRINEFVAKEGFKIANMFYEHRPRWRTTVASWIKMRAAALYWQEATQRRLCAPGGAGRAADEAEFAAEFEETSEC